MQIGGEPSKPIDPIATVARHWKKILIGGMVSLIAMAPIVKMKSKSYFEAEGKIRIDPVITTTLVGAKKSIVDQYGGYVGTEIFKIHDRGIVKAALLKLPEELRPLFTPSDLPLENALNILMKSVQVEQIRDSHLIKILLTGDKPEGLAELVNQIISIYLEKRRLESADRSRRQLEYLKTEGQRIFERTALLTQNLHEIAGLAGMSTFSEQFNPISRGVGDLQEAFTRAYSSRVEKSNTFAGVLKEEKEMKKLPLHSLIEEMVEKDQSLWDLGFYTYKTLQETRASLDGTSKNNPDRKSAEERMKGMSAHLEKLRGEVRQRAEKVVLFKRDYELLTKKIHSRHEFESAKKTETALRMELNKTKKEGAKISQLILQGQDIERELKQLNESYVAIGKRIRDLEADSLAPGRVFPETFAEIPHEPAGSNVKKILAIAMILSFGWIGGLCFMFDILDNRIRSPKELEIALGFPGGWPISHLIKGDFSRTTLDHPGSTPARAIGSLAVRLNNARLKHKAKIVVFTGIDGGSGVTALTLNTAHALRGFCKKILVMEINLIAPNMAAMVGIPKSAPGLTGILEGKSVSEAVFNDEERGISIIHTRETVQPDNGTLSSTLDQMSDDFDFVLIDAAPILKSDLTEFLAGKADVGTLIIHGDRTLYKSTRQVLGILNQLELPALAPILNWKRRKV